MASVSNQAASVTAPYQGRIQTLHSDPQRGHPGHPGFILPTSQNRGTSPKEDPRLCPVSRNGQGSHPVRTASPRALGASISPTVKGRVRKMTHQSLPAGSSQVCDFKQREDSSSWQGGGWGGVSTINNTHIPTDREIPPLSPTV